jgi:hypothetical protein
LIYFQKPSDTADGLINDILQHVPGVINATSSAIGFVADRLYPICGGGPCDQRADSSNGASIKHSGDKRVHCISPDIETQANLSGKAASNGSLQAKTKKSGAVPKAIRLVFPKIPKRGAKAGRKGALRGNQIDTTRPSNRIVDDGYDSDTRAE